MGKVETIRLTGSRRHVFAGINRIASAISGVYLPATVRGGRGSRIGGEGNGGRKAGEERGRGGIGAESGG